MLIVGREGLLCVMGITWFFCVLLGSHRGRDLLQMCCLCLVVGVVIGVIAICRDDF